MITSPASLLVSVVVPTHNPRENYLARVLEALRGQTLAKDLWELIIVDNGSKQPLRAAGLRDQETKRPRDREQESGVSPKINIVDLSWHPNARIVREERLGLTFARLRGFAEAKGELIVMVDDDNVLAPDYLETAVRIAQERPDLGAFGGKCLPEYEHEPEPWLASVTSGLGLRDRGDVPQLFPEETGDLGVCLRAVSPSLGSVEQCLPSAAPHAVSQTRLSEAVESSNPPKDRKTELLPHRVTRRVTEFPDCAPIGAGMVLRRDAAAAYAERIAQLSVVSSQSSVGADEEATITDRKGDSLASGGDNDICLTVVEEGWQVGYLPQLQLTHLIPARRMTLDYHKRMARDSMKSFILMLDQHGIRPWPAMARWTLPLRAAIDWWRVKPWQGAEQSIKFWGHLGMFDGRALLSRQRVGVDCEKSD